MNINTVEKKIYLSLLICFLVTMFGTSFAYFLSGAINITGRGGNVSANTVTENDLIKVEFNGGAALPPITGALPGDGRKIVKDFTVDVTPTSVQKSVNFSVSLNVTGNTFSCATGGCDTNNKELVYTLKRNGVAVATANEVELANMGVPTNPILLDTYSRAYTASEISSNYKDVVNYQLIIEYKDTGSSQDYNKTASFSGNLMVQFVDE